MAKLKAAMIGCGMPSSQEGRTGSAMAQAHIDGYLAVDDTEMVAIVDIKQANLDYYAERYKVPSSYTDYKEMLKKEKPDIVSISTWPALHAEMVIACANAGVKAIHCEKPMSVTWGDSVKMAEVCEKKNVQLTFNHQRRFEHPYMLAKKLVDDGAIGDLQRIEAVCGNLYDWGTHWFDMMHFYNHDVPAKWVLGQIDSRSESAIFGARLEDQGIVSIGFSNGVHGLVLTGYGHSIGAEHRLIGSEGFIEVQHPEVRVRGKGDAEKRVIKTDQKGEHAIILGIRDLVSSLKTGREPELSVRKALRATELIFATYESSRWRGRIELPLTIDDNPFLDMLEKGQIGPTRSTK